MSYHAENFSLENNDENKVIKEENKEENNDENKEENKEENKKDESEEISEEISEESSEESGEESGEERNEEINEESGEDSENSSSIISYILMMDGTIPIATSDSYSQICLYRSMRIREDITYLQHCLGNVYVSSIDENGTNTRVISCMTKNLLWSRERILKTYRISEVLRI